jgi:hypothetical protein
MASVAGRCPAWGVHPSGVVVRGPAVRPSGVQPLRCPVTWFVVRGSGGPAVCCHPSGVQPSGVHPSGVQPSGVQPAGVHPRRRSGRVRLLPHRTVTLGPGWCGGGNRHRRNRSRSRWLPCRRAARSTAQQAWGGRRCRGRASVGGGVAGRPGPGGMRAARPRVPAERPGRPGRRAERPCWRRREGTGAGCGARWPHLPRGCRPVLGARPRCVVVVEPAARVGGPRGDDGLAGGMGVRPQRGPGWQPTLPARCRQHSDLRRWVVGLPGLEPGTSS